MRSIREECLDRVILFGERRLRHAIDEFVAHYHGERNHQGLGNQLIAPQFDQDGGAHVAGGSGSSAYCAITIARPNRRSAAVSDTTRFNAGRGEAHYRKALALAEPRGMRPLVAHCHAALGRLYQRSGKREHGQAHLGDDDAPRDGHAVLVGEGRSGDDGTAVHSAAPRQPP